MTIEGAATAMLRALHDTSIPHMLVGGFSSNFYGIARSTKDVDIVIELVSRAPLEGLAKRLPDGFEFDPQVTFETITGNVRHIIKIRGTPFVIELFELADDPFQRERFSRRREQWIPQMGLHVTLPTAEDVIIQKLRWGRPKDLDDARDVMAVQAGRLDFAHIEHWCAELHITPRLQQVRAGVPPL